MSSTNKYFKGILQNDNNQLPLYFTGFPVLALNVKILITNGNTVLTTNITNGKHCSYFKNDNNQQILPTETTVLASKMTITNKYYQRKTIQLSCNLAHFFDTTFFDFCVT
ncbi:16119_t:CDS:1 [Funneliformis caledonium]|uniref:16119_t:CDS:1 n=1 Tax=Funneliformis caledonium TaxID=1117310 RepID=A0A9N8ZF29_9GLOM|nr:16119_t:CDS:1 [Funneliformis caledonium]